MLSNFTTYIKNEQLRTGKCLFKAERVSSEKKNAFDLLLHLEWVGVFSTEEKEICLAVDKKV